MNIRLFIFFIILLLAGNAKSQNPGVLSFRCGLGYDFLSQRYFLSDIDTLQPDAELNASLLQKDYLDDKKGFLYLKFRPDSQGRFDFEAGWEQTPELYRAVGRGRFSIGRGKSRLSGDLNFDLRDNFEEPADEGDDLTVVSSNVRFTQVLSKTYEAVFRTYAEKVNFDSVGTVTFNYSRFGGAAGLNIYINKFDIISLSGQLEKRIIADPSEVAQVDYLMSRVAFGYSGDISGMQTIAEITLENKDYAWTGGEVDRDDYLLFTALSSIRIPVINNSFLRPQFSLESFNFIDNSYLSDDYYVLNFGLLSEYELDNLTLSLGPELEIARISASYENDEDYLEYFLTVGTELFGSGNLFILLENEIGNRDYFNNPDYYSSFIFDRISLIGSSKLVAALSFDLLFSAEWEWHKRASDDSQLYLLSTGLSYSF